MDLILLDTHTEQLYNILLSNTRTIEYERVSKKILKNYRQYTKITATSDGNCLYNAISLCLCGRENLMEMLKLVTALTMIKHKPYFDEVVKKDVRNRDNCDFFIQEALTMSVWERPIYVYNHIGKSEEKLSGGQLYSGLFENRFEPLMLIYENNNHYNSIIKRNEGALIYVPEFEVFTQKINNCNQ